VVLLARGGHVALTMLYAGLSDDPLQVDGR
jgi:hypothetical protein